MAGCRAQRYSAKRSSRFNRMARARRGLIAASRPGHKSSVCRSRTTGQPERTKRPRTTMAKNNYPASAKLSSNGYSRRQILTASATLLILPLIPSIANAATILAVRTWPADEYTRVTLELDTELKANHFMLENPNRLVVDIHGVSMNQAIKQLVSKVKPNDPYIASIRVGQNRPHAVRLVLDLHQQIARSEERRLGDGCGTTWSSQWSTY